MTTFGDRLDTFLAELFRLDPLRATSTGMHAHDAEWPDFSPSGRSARLAFYDDWRSRFETLADDGLTADERIDRDLILLELAAATFAETELRDEAWDPLTWVYILGDGLFPLLAREFAPLADRLTSVAGRLEGFPTVVAEARAALVGHGDRPVSRLHTETALRQLPGIEDLIADALQMAEGTATEGIGTGASDWHARLIAAAAVTVARPSPRSRRISATSCFRPVRAKAGWGRSCTPGSCGTPSRASGRQPTSTPTPSGSSRRCARR